MSRRSDPSTGPTLGAQPPRRGPQPSEPPRNGPHPAPPLPPQFSPPDVHAAGYGASSPATGWNQAESAVQGELTYDLACDIGVYAALDAPEVLDIVDTMRTAGLRPIRGMLSEGYLTAADVVKLARQRRGQVALNPQTIPPSVAAIIPQWQRDALELVPVSLSESGILTVATPRPLTDTERREVKDSAGYEIRFREAERSQITAALAYLESVADDEPDDDENLTPAARKRQSEQNYRALVEGEDVVAKAIKTLIADAVARNASDIHIATQIDKGVEEVVARLRILGDLSEHRRWPPAIGEAIIHRFRRAGISTSQMVGAQDGQCDITIPTEGGRGDRYDMRMNLVPLRYGWMLTIRLLPQERSGSWDLDQLFPARESETAQRIRDALKHGSGLLILAGRTGEGKSTTLAAAMSEVASPARKVISIEDPVESLIPGVQQVPYHRVHLTFAQGLRAFLRADPDVIMVGEIRDDETAEVAITASQTGHTILTTVHARDAASAPTRLTNMGANRQQLAEEIRLIVAQRLVKKLCRVCSSKGEPKGCPACVDGFDGRTAVAETLVADEQVVQLVETGQSARALRQTPGYHSFARHAETLLANKVTTPEEVAHALGTNWRDES